MVVSDASAAEPRVLGGRYTLVGLIGRGGMAEVYRAHDRVLDRAVAVKLLRSVSGDDTDRARFGDEARTLARMSHPGLVTVLDAATSEDQPYLVMELIDGASLAECCRGVGLEPQRAANIGAQLAEALGYAHACGIVHRDLKPANVLLAADDRALVTDFGIARLTSQVTGHTGTGVTIGTAAYLAPEQVRGQDITPAVDVYALGLVLLEALTGERVYQGAPTEAAFARLHTPPRVPAWLPAGWPVLLEAMTALDPHARPSTSAVAATLRNLAAGREPSLQGTPPPAASGHTRPMAASPALTARSHDHAATAGTLHLRQPHRLRWPWPSTRPAALSRASMPAVPSEPLSRAVSAARSTPSVLARHRPLLLVAGLGLVFMLSLVLLLTASEGDGGPSQGSPLPRDVPSRLQQPLQQLHDAVNGAS
jgi:eukaryotic-like serine/threonine-protein kinase